MYNGTFVKFVGGHFELITIASAMTYCISQISLFTHTVTDYASLRTCIITGH